MLKEKLAIVINNLDGGGAEKVAIQIAKYLSNCNLDVKLILLQKKILYEVPKSINVTCLNANFSSSFMFYLMFPIYYFQLRDYLRNNNIQRVLSFLTLSNLLCCLVKITSSNLNLTISERCIPCATYSKNALKKLYFTVCCLAYNQASNIIVISKSVKKSLCKWNVTKKIHVIYNPYLPTNKKLPKRPRSSKKREFKIIQVGRLHPEKNFPFSLQALSYLKKWKVCFSLSIYGAGPEKKHLSDLIKLMKLSKLVKIKNWTARIDKIYPKYDLFLSTSPFESFGNAIIEASSYGLPIIAMKDSGGPVEILRNGQLGLLSDKTHPKKLALQLFKIINNTKLYEKMSQNALKIPNLFSLKTVGLKYKKVIFS